MNEERIPVLVGAGQCLKKYYEPIEELEPLVMLAETARRAAEDSGGGDRLLQAIDRVSLVFVRSWEYQNLPRLLAGKLGAHPKDEITTIAGGQTPQWLVNQAARDIQAGRLSVALITGAESINARRKAEKAGIEIPWSSGGSGAPLVLGKAGNPGFNDYEKDYGLWSPVYIYPLFENAWRAHHKLDMGAHREKLGRLFSPFTEVAAQNPYAWFQESLTPEELITPTADNRMISFPYTKKLIAILDVNQAASVIMTSVSAARSFGIPEDRWVYWWGGHEAVEDPWFVSERPKFHVCEAMVNVANTTLESAGVTIDEMDFIDLYSCFPCAVQIACDSLGIEADGGRPLTVTGGLPYHGQPGTNYSTHAIATMMDKLRAAPGAKGYVGGNGMYLSKQSAGVYSTEPKEPSAGKDAAKPEIPSQGPAPEMVREADGRGFIETYTVIYDRENQPVRGIIIGRLDDGRRFIAHTPEDRPLLEGLMESEAVGRIGKVTSKDGLNLFDLE